MEPERKVTVEVDPLERLGLAKRRRQLTLTKLQERMGDLGVKASTGHLSEILSGTTPLTDVREDVLVALLISLGINRLEDIGLTPKDAPITHLALRAHAEHGLPFSPGGGGNGHQRR